MPTINNNEVSIPNGNNEEFETVDRQEEKANATYHTFESANKITVSIIDKRTPILVLVGPPSCGKTMLMCRLTIWLRHNGYTVTPDYDFRAEQDKSYKNLCDDFDTLISSVEEGKPAQSTSKIDFMLLKVFKGAKPVCQILEAPGEHYFDPDNPKEPNPTFLPYVTAIANSPNKKFWAIMTEPSWKSSSVCSKYVQKIERLQKMMHVQDESIIVYNKIDKTENVGPDGRVDVAEAKREMANYYVGLFNAFCNNTPIVKWFKPYRCEFIPFQTGFYHDDGDTVSFTLGDDRYPSLLWSIIIK